jgi:phenylalanyl-tRNA synthetase alpha chain
MDQESINIIINEFRKNLGIIKTSSDLESIRIKYLGKTGIIAKLFNEFSVLPIDQKKQLGQAINSLKKQVETELSVIPQKSDIKTNSLEDFYRTLPGKLPQVGHLHIITQAIREITEIFKPLGFTRVRHPEIDWEYFAFEALNMPKTHPARDEWETFFIDAPENPKFGKLVITPHTSNGQVREMLTGNLPIRMLNISRCGRRQEDLNHLTTFFQFEGLLVDKNISISHLKGVLDYFARNFFGPDRVTRLRPYNFRFTEPSFEVDINCGLCQGSGCKFCKGGWVELGGAGMVHPNVLKAGKIDPSVYSGFAFGWGVERTYAMKSGTKIDDIRHLFNNDLRFLEQF